ncbi:MAG: hypothetical protein AAF441_22065, partial [Pseudomonadota bacterium]
RAAHSAARTSGQRPDISPRRSDVAGARMHQSETVLTAGCNPCAAKRNRRRSGEHRRFETSGFGQDQAASGS